MFNFLKRKESKVTQESEVKNAVFFPRLQAKISRMRQGLAESIASVFLGKKVIDEVLLAELETRLITADLGVTITKEIIANLTAQLKRKELTDAHTVWQALQATLSSILLPYSQPLVINEKSKPFVILVVGVNGAGKTTTIGKLTKYLQQQGKKVVLAAGDTFRAAAIEQLTIWGECHDVHVVAQKSGADSAAVIYDAFRAAQARHADVLIADTAGRLHTQNSLMDELKKIRRTIQKIDPTAPHETLLILDATIGQNALNQAQEFNDAIGITGLCLTKLDGTAKGGIIFAIVKKLQLPIRFIGVGEQADDLQPFIAEDFIAALFD